MAFATIMTRGILRTSREVIERNMSVGAVTMLHGQVNVDINIPQTKSNILAGKISAVVDFLIQLILGRVVVQHSALTQHQKTTSPIAVLPKKLVRQQLFVKSQQHNGIISSKRGYHEKSAKSSARRQDDSDSDSDSDDELERKRQDKHLKHSQRGDSEFWRRKMRTLHRILDVNRDGVISFEDFNLLAKRFTDLGHLTPEVSAEFDEVMKQTWQEQFGELSPYNLVTAEQFLTDIHHRLNDKKMAKRIARFLPYLFKAVDYDHTGHLDLDQYKLFFRCLGLTDEDAAISFAVIDTNGDGQLSMKEFVHLGRQFFLTEDEMKISKMFWGPLIDH